MLAIAREVTARKRAEERVRRLNEELEEQVAERTARLGVEVEAALFRVAQEALDNARKHTARATKRW